MKIEEGTIIAIKEAAALKSKLAAIPTVSPAVLATELTTSSSRLSIRWASK